MTEKCKVILAKVSNEIEFGRVQIASATGSSSVVLWDKLHSRTPGFKGCMIGPVITEERSAEQEKSIFESQVDLGYAVEVAHAILALARAKGVITDPEPEAEKAEEVLGYVNVYSDGFVSKLYATYAEASSFSKITGTGQRCKIVRLKD